jgi:hypothetical protein
MSDTPEYEWDEEKNRSNQKKHGVAFEEAFKFDWDTCTEFEDNRFDYGELRWVVIGRIGGQIYTMSYTLRGETIRVISLRRATAQERRIYHG